MKEKYLIGLANLSNGALLGYGNKEAVEENKARVNDYVKELEKGNKQLKDNWNKLKEYLKDYNSLSHLFENDYDWEYCMNKIINKMQELESGDSNE